MPPYKPVNTTLIKKESRVHNEVDAGIVQHSLLLLTEEAADDLDRRGAGEVRRGLDLGIVGSEAAKLHFDVALLSDVLRDAVHETSVLKCSVLEGQQSGLVETVDQRMRGAHGIVIRVVAFKLTEILFVLPSHIFFELLQSFETIERTRLLNAPR